MIITLFKGATFHILTENLTLKHFNDVKFSSSLHFKALKFRYLIFKVEHNISFLKHLS